MTYKEAREMQNMYEKEAEALRKKYYGVSPAWASAEIATQDIRAQHYKKIADELETTNG